MKWFSSYETKENLVVDALEATSAKITWGESKMEACEDATYTLTVYNRDNERDKKVLFRNLRWENFKSRFKDREWIHVTNLKENTDYRASLQSDDRSVFNGRRYGSTHECNFKTEKKIPDDEIPETDLDALNMAIEGLLAEIGDTVAIVLAGEQGAGKSTTLNMFNTCRRPWVDAEPIGSMTTRSNSKDTVTLHGTEYEIEQKDSSLKICDTPGLGVRNQIWGDLENQIIELINSKQLPGHANQTTDMSFKDLDILVYVVDATQFSEWAENNEEYQRAGTLCNAAWSGKIKNKVRIAPQTHVIVTHIDQKFKDFKPPEIFASHQWRRFSEKISKMTSVDTNHIHPIINNTKKVRKKDFERLALVALRIFLQDAKVRKLHVKHALEKYSDP